MIHTVVKNLLVSDANFIFIVQKQHNLKYGLTDILQNIAPGSKLVEIDGLTDGAACTVLCAAHLIDNDAPLLIANSDQYLEWDSQAFVDFLFNDDSLDGLISTFIKDEPDTKWSYAKLNDKDYVVEVQEKVPISNIATTGIYMWRRGSDYVKYAKQMIKLNIRANNEFYVFPVYNEAIKDGLKFKVDHCKKMWGIGYCLFLIYL